MALTVQSIANDVSLDVRQALLATGSDLTILTGFIDRIHKDCLHSSIYSYLIRTNGTFPTVVGQTEYQLGSLLADTANLRRILGVYDTTKNRILFPLERATSPVSQVQSQEPSPGQAGSAGISHGDPLVMPISLQGGQAGYYKLLGIHGSTDLRLQLVPTPSQVSTISISWEDQVADLVNPSDVLRIPADGRDMVVAGVDYLTNIYLKRAEEAQAWAQLYMSLKKGESLV